MYNKYKKEIDSNLSRGNGYHLDHKVSICYGYQTSISPKIVGDINNLEMLSVSDNTSKQYKNSVSLQSLFEKYNDYYTTNEIPPIDEKFQMPSTLPTSPKATNTTIGGKCKYCGVTAFYVNINGEHQCGETYHTCTNARPKDKDGRFIKKT